MTDPEQVLPAETVTVSIDAPVELAGLSPLTEEEREEALERGYQDYKTDAAYRRTQLAQRGIRPPAAASSPISTPLDPDGRVSVAVYRLAAQVSPRLSHAEFRVLNGLLSFADSGTLGNCFPGRQLLLTRIGGVTKVTALARHLAALERKGWIERVRFRTNDRERFSSSGYRFRLPAGEITPTDVGWEGPALFDKRDRRRMSSARRTAGPRSRRKP